VSQRMSHARRVAAQLVATTALCGLFASSAGASGLQVQSVTPWAQNASPMGWSSSLNRVFYNVKGADGMFDAYSASPDGSDPECLTCAAPTFPGVGAATNRGVSDVSPDGNWMLLSVENPSAGQTGAAYTQPGKGDDNDVWLASTDGSQAWPLTDITAPGQVALGTNWARFNRTGTQIVWASMYAPALVNLGLWQLKVADIVWSGGVPSLADIRTIDPDPGSFYEPYGFTPDDAHIIFASDAGQPSWTDTQIDTIATDGTGLTQLSPSEPADGVFSEYNEFAFYVPGTNQIIYGRSRDATSGGLDYWDMNLDGSGQQRLTYFNEPWSTQSMGYTVVGGLAFDPDDPDRVIAGVASDDNAQNINAVTINLGTPSASQGLLVQYFAGQSAAAPPVSSSVQNPSDGFVTTGSPTTGVPASDYSIRWSGTVTAPVAGTYSLCVVTDDSAQLYLGGNLLINAGNSFGQRRCAAAALPAGSPVAIVMTDQHLLGTAYAQLSWIPPGAASPSAIPSADLAPQAVAIPGAAAAATATAPATATPTRSTTPTRRRHHAKHKHRTRHHHRRRHHPRAHRGGHAPAHRHAARRAHRPGRRR
jgi:hypothetical protein